MSRLNDTVKMVKEGSGDPLVLLHCLGVDHHFWDFASALGADFTLYRYDLPGHGTTPVPPGPYSIHDLTDQLARIMQANKIEHAHLAGISLGGLIAQDFAARYPDRISKLILVDTTPRYTDEMRDMWHERAATARNKGVEPMVDTLLSIWFSADAIARDTDAVRYVRAALSLSNGEGYALACEALAGADLRDAAARIEAPTLIVCGDDDIPSFLDAARWLAEHIPDAKSLWIKNARHASVIEHPSFATEQIALFLHDNQPIERAIIG